MYNEQFLAVASTEIESQLRKMPGRFDSREFYEAFAQNHAAKYEQLLAIYTGRGHDRPHAIQIVNSQLMHTVNDRFSHIAHKIGDIANPKGGDMSEWSKA